MSIRHSSTTARLAGLLLGAAVALTACTGSGSESGRDEATPAATANPCAVGEGQKPATQLVSCGEQSIVLIETPLATGTGVAVRVDDEDYVVTNLHVVDPFDAAEVSLGGIDPLGAVPLVGADVASDVALLGPLEDVDGLRPLPLGDPSVDKGDDVFLVGFPGTARLDDADLTITSGIMSRSRTAEGWDQSYLQSDAVIADGQSGGALFTAAGDLAGISGLSFDESFSLSLSIQDVERSVERILDDGGDDLLLAPVSVDQGGADQGGETSGTIDFDDDIESYTLLLPPSEDAREWEFAAQGPADVIGVYIGDLLAEDVLAEGASSTPINEEYARQVAERTGASVEELFGTLEPLDPEVAAREVAPNSFRLEVPADALAQVVISVAVGARDIEVGWTSTLPLWQLTEPAPVTTLALDEPVEGTISGFRSGVLFEVALEEGDEVRITASSPTGDLDVVLAPPGAPMTSVDVDPDVEADGFEYFIDSGEGLYGVGVDEPFTATATGAHRLWLTNYEMTPIAYRVEVAAQK